ncbi:MAG TPA: hypothetical protein VIN11_04140, partial [Roseivirga sp.]
GVRGERGQATPRERFDNANNWLGQARRYASNRLTAPGPNEMSLKENAQQMMNEAMQLVNDFFTNEWPAFKAAYEKTNFDFFKDFSQPIKN